MQALLGTGTWAGETWAGEKLILYPWIFQSNKLSSNTFANHVVALGAYAGTDGAELRSEANDTVSQAALGRTITAVVADRTITSQSVLDLAASVELGKRATLQTITFQTYPFGDGSALGTLEVGQLVNIISEPTGITNGSFIIQSLVLKQLAPTLSQWTITCGDFQGSLQERMRELAIVANPPQATATPPPDGSVDSTKISGSGIGSLPASSISAGTCTAAVEFTDPNLDFTVVAHGGAPTDTDFHIDTTSGIEVTDGVTKITIDGTVQGPVGLGGVNADLALQIVEQGIGVGRYNYQAPGYSQIESVNGFAVSEIIVDATGSLPTIRSKNYGDNPGVTDGHVLWASSVNKKLMCGTAQMTAGSMTISPGLALQTVDSAVAVLFSAGGGSAAVIEYAAVDSISGSTVIFKSSNAASTAFYYYFIFGSVN